jgi:hypothetical protein
VIDNAIKYNKYDTQFYKVATRLRAMSKVVLPQLNDVIVPPTFKDPHHLSRSTRKRSTPPLNMRRLLIVSAIWSHLCEISNCCSRTRRFGSTRTWSSFLATRILFPRLVAYELGVPKRTEPSPPSVTVTTSTSTSLPSTGSGEEEQSEGEG